MYLVRAMLFVAAAAALSFPAEAAEVRRLLLAAGANNGGVDRELLRYAVTDAENFVDVMQEMGGLDPADVLLLRNPGLADFEQGLAEAGAAGAGGRPARGPAGGAALLLRPRRPGGPASRRRPPGIPAAAPRPGDRSGPTCTSPSSTPAPPGP